MLSKSVGISEFCDFDSKMTGSRCEPDSFQSRVLTYLPDFKEILGNTPRILELIETHKSRFIPKLRSCREGDQVDDCELTNPSRSHGAGDAVLPDIPLQTVHYA